MKDNKSMQFIPAENERQQKFYKEESKSKRKTTTKQDERMQMIRNIYKRLKTEESDEPNDDYVASDPTFLEKRGKGVVVSEAKKGFTVKTTRLKRQYNIKKSLKIPYRIRPRSPPSSFSLLMCKLSDDQKAAIREMGFASMLDFKINKIPTVMGYQAVRNFDHKACTLQVRDASLKVTIKTIHDVLGVPMGEINAFNLRCKRNLATQEFRKQFPATKKGIHVTDVIRKMVKQEKGGRLFKLNFLVLFVTVMAEGVGGVVNQKFLSCIRKLGDARNMDWCQYILECLVRTRKRWNPENHYNGPLVFLVVFYAHSINPKNIGKETLVPVINMWTSDMLMELEEEEFNTGRVEEPAIQKLIVIESDESDDDVPLKDRVTSLKRKRTKHDTLESCNTQVFNDSNNNKEAPENVYDVEGDLDIENDAVGSDDGELNRDDTQNIAEELGTPHVEHCVEGLYIKYDGRVHSSGRPKKPTTKELNAKDDDGNEELLDHNREQLELDESVSPMSDCLGQQLPRKASTPQCSIICVQGYEVKESVAPILEAIFKKHGDIAAECIFTIASVRASLLEFVCEVVRRIQANDVVEKMEEIESQVSQVEAAKIDVSWLRVHLEATIYKRKRAAQMVLKERYAELVAAEERFKNGKRCVKVLDLVEKNLNDYILESKAEEDLWAKEPILEPLHEKVSSPRSGIICVRGYQVKEGVGRILEALFTKHGDIAAECVFKTASLRASLLEVVCEVVRRILIDDVAKIISEMEEIKSQVSDADAVNVNVSWIKVHLEAIHKRNEAMKKSTMLMEIKSTTTLVKLEAQKDLEERNAELVATQKRFEKAERCVKVLGLVETKLSNDILESKAEKDSWVEQPVL